MTCNSRRFSNLTAMFVLFGAAACTTGGDDTGNPGDTTGDPSPVVASIGANDYFTAEPIEGVTVVMGDQTTTTDGSGQTQLEIARDADFVVTMTNDGYHDTHVCGHTAAVDFDWNAQLVSRETTALLAAVLGLEADPTKGTVSVAVLYGSETPVVGASVDLDVAYDVALAPDSSTVSGLSEGNTLTEDTPGMATINFINVTTGSATPKVTPPPGEACVVHPGTADGMQLEVLADAFSVIAYKCEPVD